MKIIALGGTGLIGNHITLELLENGHKITVVGRGTVDF